MGKRENIEFVDSKVEREEITTFSAKSFLDGSWLTLNSFVRRLPFILFCVLLMLIYIANRFHAEKMVRKTVHMKKEIQNLRAEEITASYELIKLNRPSEIQKRVEHEELGLKFHTEPPKKIIKK
ncbi:MAG: hypothetical protein JW801_18660 [Bacteroidales bacterium]|nr:hypothetical protein [Bacteroidales bacterium]